MKRVIITSFLGNALEFYDFVLYGAFATLIGQTFFPSYDPLTSLLNSLAVFAVGFIMRPFGALIFGHIGDTYGRKLALQLSVLSMGLPTLIIGITPSYDSIGIAAPILVIFSRLLQGLSTGGEYNGAAIFALEHAQGKNQGFVGGVITASAGLGALMGMAFSLCTLNKYAYEWAWRIPFIIGFLGSILAFLARLKVRESPVFKPEQKENLLPSLKRHKKAAFTTFVLGTCDGILSYISFVFLETFLETQGGISASSSRFIGLLSILGFIIGAPLFGCFLDKKGGKKTILTLIASVLCFIFPAFYFLNSPYMVVLIGVAIYFGLAAGGLAGSLHAFVQNLFPVGNRYQGVSFTFSLGISLGGMTPYILTYLWKYFRNFWSLGLYVVLWMLVCALLVVKWRPENLDVECSK